MMTTIPTIPNVETLLEWVDAEQDRLIAQLQALRTLRTALRGVSCHAISAERSTLGQPSPASVKLSGEVSPGRGDRFPPEEGGSAVPAGPGGREVRRGQGPSRLGWIDVAARDHRKIGDVDSRLFSILAGEDGPLTSEGVFVAFYRGLDLPHPQDDPVHGGFGAKILAGIVNSRLGILAKNGLIEKSLVSVPGQTKPFSYWSLGHDGGHDLPGDPRGGGVGRGNGTW